MYPTSHSITAWIGSSFPVTLNWISGSENGWIEEDYALPNVQVYCAGDPQKKKKLATKHSHKKPFVVTCCEQEGFLKKRKKNNY